MKISRALLEEILENSPDKEYIEVDLDRLAKRGFCDAVAGLAYICNICTNGSMTNEEKLDRILEESNPQKYV
ncbi:MAG: hypothetical protein IJ366_07555 [Clostridia bacterium]|nr:hypothetical protein [Clostridia bacterium]